MKQFFSYLGASLAAIAALASCNKEIDAPIEDLKGGVPFEICASTADTKTAIDGLATSWVANDAINLFHAVAGTTTYISDGEFKITAENLAANKFKGTLNGELTAESYDWYAIYPYNKNISTPANTGTNGWVTVGGTTQTQEDNDSKAHLCNTVCPLYGVATGVASNVAPSVKMNHLASIIEVNVINNSGKELTISNISFTGSEDIVGTYFINFVKTPVAYKASGADFVSTTASLTVSNGDAIANGSSAKFYIAVKPFTATSTQTLKLSVNGYEKEISHSSDVTFTAGKIKKINFKYDKGPEVYTLVQTDGAFEDGGKYVFAFKNGTDDTYYFISNGGSTNNLSKSALTISGGKITNPSVSYVFTATANASGFKLANSAGKYIYNSGSSTSLNTNNNTASTWYPTFSSASKTYKLSQGSTTGRYISYGTSETKAMGYANSSFKDQINTKVALTQYCGAISVFKLGYSVTLDPAILADNVTGVSARGLSAVELTCNIENPVEGLTLSAACDGTVVTKAGIIDGAVVYSVAQNTGEARDGSITLTYGDVTKVVKVSQLAPVFKVSRTEVELEAAANSSSTITVTSDFDWTSVISTGAGFTSTPTTCEWNDENPFTDGKTTVTITATAGNASKEGTKTLGTLTFTNKKTSEKLVVTVTQKSSYVEPVLGNSATGSLTSGKEDVTLEEGKAITYSDVKIGKDYGQYTPGRFYASNEFVVSSSAGNITKITITCSESKYVKVLKTTMTNENLGTVSTSSNDVSIDLTSPATTVTFTNSAQWRASKMTVTYE